jgi:hypothetical protein
MPIRIKSNYLKIIFKNTGYLFWNVEKVFLALHSTIKKHHFMKKLKTKK